jgi:hypothetical protein
VRLEAAAVRSIPIRAATAVGAALLAFVLAVALPVGEPDAEWAAPTGDLESLSDDRFWIRPADGLHDQRQMTLDELRGNYPYEIELPRTMPEGYSLFLVTLTEAGWRDTALDRSWLELRFLRGTDEASDIYFLQAQGDSFGELGDAAVEASEVSVHGERALYVTKVRLPSGLEPYERLMWARCGRLYELHPSWNADMSWDDLIRIAESTGPEDCE